MGGRGKRSLKARVGRKCCIGRGEAKMNSAVYKLEDSEEEVTVLSEETGTQQGESSGCESWQEF